MTLRLIPAALAMSLIGCTDTAMQTTSAPGQTVEASANASAVRSVNFGNNSGAHPNDGECDDPRFVGAGMASSVDDANIARDATDCRAHFRLQNIRLARLKSESSVAECRAIDFGNNASQWARDGECDDPRFTGPGTDNIMQIRDLKADARDCRALCQSGQVWLK